MKSRVIKVRETDERDGLENSGRAEEKISNQGEGLVSVIMQIIHQVMALGRKVETFLIELEALDGSPECTDDHHKSFYTSATGDVSTIQVRTAASSNNIYDRASGAAFKEPRQPRAVSQDEAEERTGRKLPLERRGRATSERFNASFVASSD